MSSSFYAWHSFSSVTITFAITSDKSSGIELRKDEGKYLSLPSVAVENLLKGWSQITLFDINFQVEERVTFETNDFPFLIVLCYLMFLRYFFLDGNSCEIMLWKKKKHQTLASSSLPFLHSLCLCLALVERCFTSINFRKLTFEHSLVAWWVAGDDSEINMKFWWYDDLLYTFFSLIICHAFKITNSSHDDEFLADFFLLIYFWQARVNLRYNRQFTSSSSSFTSMVIGAAHLLFIFKLTTRKLT